MAMIQSSVKQEVAARILRVQNSDVALTRKHLRNLLAAQARASYFA
jgi:hypothetical protein